MRGIEAREERCRGLIEQSLAMCTVLAPRIGYDAASGVAEVAAASGRNVRDVLMDLVGKGPAEVEAILKKAPTADAPPLAAEEIDRLLEPHGQTIRGTGAGGAGGG